MVIVTEDDLQQLFPDENASVLENVSDGEGERYEDLEEPLQLDESFPTSILVANVPQVNAEKHAKLSAVLKKLFSKIGDDDNAKQVTVQVYMPINPASGSTDGAAVITYEHPDHVDMAVAKMDGLSLDANHTFKVIRLDAMTDIMNRPDEFDAAAHKVAGFSRSEERDWVLDQKGREQIMIRYQDETEVLWFDPMEKDPILIYGGEREKMNKKVWCDSRVAWSSYGSFLVTFHRPGVAQWSGPEFTKKHRFMHGDVRFLEFSPDEEYMLTWNGSHPDEGDSEAIKIWHTRTGELARGCPTPHRGPNYTEEWPLMTWSPDGKYLARTNGTDIFLYGAPTFQSLMNEKGQRVVIKLDSVEEFQWAPKKHNVIAVWTLDDPDGNTPARVRMIEVPSCREVQMKSLYNCRDAKLHWQNAGDYFALQVTRVTKAKKQGFTAIEIFRMKEKNCPVDSIEFKEQVRGFFWENHGNRFAVLTQSEDGTTNSVVFYQIQKDSTEEVARYDMGSTTYNTVFWAPFGQYFVLATVGSGEVLFGSLNENNVVDITHKDEHFMLNECHWDPSARYVITAVTTPMESGMGFRHSDSAGFKMWTFQGRLLHQSMRERLWQVQWRPHPPSLLADEKVSDIRKNLRDYSKRFESEDDAKNREKRQERQDFKDKHLGDFWGLFKQMQDIKMRLCRQSGFDRALQRQTAAERWEEREEKTEQEISRTEEVLAV